MSSNEIWSAALISFVLFGCGQAQEGDASRGSNWLRCETARDCRGALAAASCSADGFCEDGEGERIVSTDLSGREAPLSCAWGVDELLNEIPDSAPDRRNCGSYTTRSAALGSARSCFDEARAAGVAVQITVNRCIDCIRPVTYVATAAGELYETTMGDDTLQRIASAVSCDEVTFDEDERDFVCQGRRTRYECSESRDIVRAATKEPPVTPFKLTDLTLAPGGESAVFHLFVSNQNFGRPLVDIYVRIDDVDVVVGDFDVGSQHNWQLFEIRLPPGKHRISAHARGGLEMLDAQETDVSETPWGVLDYWGGDSDSGPLLLQTLAQQPVFG